MDGQVVLQMVFSCEDLATQITGKVSAGCGEVMDTFKVLLQVAAGYEQLSTQVTGVRSGNMVCRLMSVQVCLTLPHISH